MELLQILVFLDCNPEQLQAQLFIETTISLSLNQITLIVCIYVVSFYLFVIDFLAVNVLTVITA